jgi:hypothetical protein
MQRKLIIAALCLAGSGWIAPAAAQNIYRCGNSYSQQPCPGGTLVPADDARSASQRSQTSLASERDAKAADAMEKARLNEEAKPAQVAMPPAKLEEIPQEERQTVVEGKAKKPAYFTAVARKPGDTQVKKKKKKAKKKAV